MLYYEDLTFVNSGKITPAPPVKRPFGFRYWGIQFCRQGTLQLQIGDGEKQTATGPVAFLSFPGPEFYYDTGIDREAERYYCCFQGERLVRWIKGGLFEERRENALIRLDQARNFSGQFDELLQLLRTAPSPTQHARAVLLVEQLLLQIAGSRNFTVTPDCRGGRTKFEALAGAIWENPEQEWDFVVEAAKMSLSYSHFRRIFCRLFAMPPGKYVLEARLSKAARMLVLTDEKSSTIAHACGFEDEYYFSRIFRKHRCLSPRNYRREFR